MADSQKMGGAKSGGMRIDNHASWIGAAGKSSVFPDGPHKVKNESSAEGAGSLMSYEDTTEKIRSAQEMAKAKQKGHDRKPLQRN